MSYIYLVVSLLLFSAVDIQASCLQKYRSKNTVPSDDERADIALISSTAASVYDPGTTFISYSLALSTGGAAQDALSSSTDAIYEATVSTLNASGLIQGYANFEREISLLEDARLFPYETGSQLLNITDDLNDLLSTDEALFSVEEVANLLKSADKSERFCQNKGLLDIDGILEFIKESM